MMSLTARTLAVALASALALAACSGGSDDPGTECDPAVACSGHGTCVIGGGASECTCAAGYSGSDCSACAADHVDEGAGCIHSKWIDCTDVSPQNATAQVVQVEITYSTAGGWSPPAVCAFTCNTDYALVDGACLNTMDVPCTDAPPPNATSTTGTVQITYTTAGGWTQPAACAFTCNTDHALVDGTCLNTMDVPCTDAPPPNATSTPGTVQITYTTAGGWTPPAACAWTCDQGFHAESSACVANVDMTGAWCGIVFPLTFTAETGSATSVYGQIYVTGTTEAAGAAPGIKAVLCHSSSAMTYPVNVETLTCVDASYLTDAGNNDEYLASFASTSSGTFDLVYAFSGDGGASWTACDTGGVVNDPVEPAIATITPATRTLFFSEYVEGSSFNKALEIHNPTDTAVDLGAQACTIRLYSNGAATPSSSATLSGTLAVGDSLVICHPSAPAPLSGLCDTTSAVVNFNGDDAVELSCNGATLDVIGQIGFDPGTNWGSAPVSTLDQTLGRKCTNVNGDAVGSDPFDPASQWDAFPVDTFDGLGSHVVPCGG